jgi:hypothetical protein
VRAAIHRFLTLRAAAFFETKEHRPDKRHERALAGLIRAMKNIQTWIERSPGLVVPDPESIDMDVFNSH